MRRPTLYWTEWDRGIYWRVSRHRLLYFWSWRAQQVWLDRTLHGRGWMLPRFGQVKS
jgi:hypothetical protein